jgi:S1-C subfamily serine protease
MLATLILALVLLPIPGTARVYKHKDKDGKWVFTDAPNAVEKDMAAVKKDHSHRGNLIDLEQQLRQKFNPQNPIEEATLGTVTVKTKGGSGSGFFVTNTGYIITNKHVVRIDQAQYEDVREQIKEAEKTANEYEYQFSLEQDRLRQFKRELHRYRDDIRNSANASERRRKEYTYQRALDQYKASQSSLDSARSDFYQRRQHLSKTKWAYDNQIYSVNTAHHFTIVLKDQVELDVHLVTVSRDHDLALLKLDGYKTPSLRLAPASKIPQGASVYAIGSPIGISDSVASGILSGYTTQYIKTDAKIYPGNSGGPLLDDAGNVIGINTLKQVTYKFEGLGFAIPIQTALDAFQSKLQSWTTAAD